MKRGILFLSWLLVVSYPVLVYLGLAHFGGRAVGALCLFVVFLRYYITREKAGTAGSVTLLLAALLFLGAMLLNAEKLYLFVPAIMSSIGCAVFIWSLITPPSVVERIALRLAGTLSEEELTYCRMVSWSWVIFLAINGSIALVLALWAPLSWWALYNGLLSYLLMGAMFVGELFYRHWRFRRYIGLPTDEFFRRLFPPVDA